MKTFFKELQAFFIKFANVVHEPSVIFRIAWQELTCVFITVRSVFGEVAALAEEYVVFAAESPVEVLPEDGLDSHLRTRAVKQLQLVQFHTLVLQYHLLAGGTCSTETILCSQYVRTKTWWW